MKTTLLFVIAVVLSCAVFAQKKQAPTQPPMKVSGIYQAPVNPQEPVYTPGEYNQPNYVTKSSSSLSKILIGSSINAYTLLIPYQRCMDYNAKANALMHTHRGDNVTPGFGTGNQTVVAWSDDLGASWVEKVGFNGNTTDRCRYPSGMIYNPGNSVSVINGLYSVVAGPITNGSSWVKTFWGSRTYDNTNVNEQLFTIPTADRIYRNYMTVTDNGIATIGDSYENADAGSYSMEYYHGVWNGTTNQFDVTYKTFDTKPWVLQSVDGYEGYPQYAQAWAKDGSIGYMYTIAADNRNTDGCSYYPLVFKTTDGGANWEPLDYFDFGLLPEVYAHLIDMAGYPGRVAPKCYEVYEYTSGTYYSNVEMDGVVDTYGNLHLFTVALSSLSVHPDSLGWFYPSERENIFEFEYNHSANEWMGWWIDTLRTDPTGTMNTPYGTVTWDHRLQASMSPDGTKVFCVWTDSDPDLWGLSEPYADLAPDVKVWGRDITTNKFTNPMNMTYGEEGWGESYFMFVSPTAIAGNGYTEIPLSIEDLATNSFNPDAPVFHYYLKGVQISDADFVNVSAPSKPLAGKSKVSANYPNPFSGNTSIDVTIDATAAVKVVVSSITGQQVAAVNYGTLASGKHTLKFDGSHLTSGVYFYTVTIGDQNFTNKMIVK